MAQDADARAARHALGRFAPPCVSQRRGAGGADLGGVRCRPALSLLTGGARAHPGGGMPTQTAGVPGVLGRQERYSQHWTRAVENTLLVRGAQR